MVKELIFYLLLKNNKLCFKEKNLINLVRTYEDLTNLTLWNMILGESLQTSYQKLNLLIKLTTIILK